MKTTFPVALYLGFTYKTLFLHFSTASCVFLSSRKSSFNYGTYKYEGVRQRFSIVVHATIHPSRFLCHPSTCPSICRPFPVMPLVRLSVYLPWHPADVYCDGLEYSSYQYGLDQCWIIHSGLAGSCPPAAYSNIVSRIVNIRAELWAAFHHTTEYSQRKNTKSVSAFHFLQSS